MTQQEIIGLVLLMISMAAWLLPMRLNDKLQKYDDPMEDFIPFDNTKPRPYDWLDALLGYPPPEEKDPPTGEENEEK